MRTLALLGSALLGQPAPPVVDARLRAIECPEEAVRRVADNGLSARCQIRGIGAHGPAIWLHPNGGLSGEGTYDRGTKVGVWRHFYDNGEPNRVEGYDEEGRLHGERMTWHLNGTPSGATHFAHGKAVGMDTKWHLNGTVWTERPYTDGRQDGVFRTWSSDGLLLERTRMAGGSYEGVRETWWPDGTPRRRSMYVAGREFGPALSWWPDGTLQQILEMYDGHKVGSELNFHENGTAAGHQIYDWQGRQTGLWRWWNDDGTLRSWLDIDDPPPRGEAPDLGVICVIPERELPRRSLFRRRR